MSALTSRLSSVRTKTSHVIVIARAGTGKTTTMIEGLKRMRGLATSITPSPQQEDVWAELEKSKGARFVCMTSFNRSIASELKRRVPPNVDAKTIHGLGFSSVNRRFKLKKEDGVDGDLPAKLMIECCPDWDTFDWDKRAVLLAAVPKLVGLAKAHLMDPTWDNLDALAGAYDVELNGSAPIIFDLVEKVLATSRDPEAIARRKVIDFNDMVWLPVVLNLPVFIYDLILVDEAQDLNRAQQALVQKAGRRLVLCGDPAQAIYGFAGADCQSLPRMEQILGDTPAGVTMLELNVTYRCGKKIVEEAQAYVPDFRYHESNPEGSVIRLSYEEDRPDQYRVAVRSGDMILCRTNAPLVSQVFKFIKEKRKATIQGRDIGKGLLKMVEKLGGKNLKDLAARLQKWYEYEVSREEAKKFPSEPKLISLADRRDCLNCFIEECRTISEVKSQIEAIFTDSEEQGILLSSIHKAKGLEAPNVFLLCPPEVGFPHPMAKTPEAVAQEYNLRYVAITRAIKRLVYVA